MTTSMEARPAGDDVFLAVQRFLYREAALLDGREYRRWLDVLTEDIQYSVMAQLSKDLGAEPVAFALIDEGATELKSRIDQICNSRLTRAENPPSFMRRFVSNIEAHHTDDANEFDASSYLLAYRGRSISPEGGFYVGVRHDLLRRQGGQLRLARRIVRLDQSIIFDGALSVIL